MAVAIGKEKVAAPIEELEVQSGRIPYFDQLRVLALAGVVVFHAVLPFANVGWWVSNISGSVNSRPGY